MDHIAVKKDLTEGGYQKVATGNEAYDSSAASFPGGSKPPLVRRPSTGKCKDSHFVFPHLSHKAVEIYQFL